MIMQDKDTVPAAHTERLNKLEVLFDRMYLLAGVIACHDAEETLPVDVFDEMQDIEDELFEFPKMSFLFSGHGFMPVALPDGEVDTIFGIVRSMTGTFAGFDLAQAEDFEHISEKELDEDLDDGDLRDSKVADAIKQKILPPDPRIKLYAEFLLNHEPLETPIAGSAVRATGTKTYASIDAETLVLDGINDSRPVVELVDEDNIEEALMREATSFRKLLYDTRFRYKPSAEQEQILEDRLAFLNDEFSLDRFNCQMRPRYIYVADTSGKDVKIRKIELDTFTSSFMIEPIRLDSLFALTKDNRVHQKKRIIDPRAGLCMVAEVHEHVRDTLELGSNIIWIPIKNSAQNSSFSAHFMLKTFNTQ